MSTSPYSSKPKEQKNCRFEIAYNVLFVQYSDFVFGVLRHIQKSKTKNATHYLFAKTETLVSYRGGEALISIFFGSLVIKLTPALRRLVTCIVKAAWTCVRMTHHFLPPRGR